ncbi:hypothetical protein BDZ89DRAFT_177125 [Hymenopellis radicata]|nr:hypothetical protein BDZ89DRAFT_177125 [Hymenopellis radicata]
MCSRCKQATIIVITDVGASAKHGGALVGGPDDATFDQVGCQFTKCRNSTCGDFKGIDPSGFTAAQLERMPSVIYWLRERERLLATVPPPAHIIENHAPLHRLVHRLRFLVLPLLQHPGHVPNALQKIMPRRLFRRNTG